MKPKVILLSTLAAALVACAAPALPTEPAARPSPAVTFTPTAAPPASPTARPSPTTTPTPACTEPRGRLEQGAYPGAVAQGAVPVLVYLPACYDVDPAAYLLLILLHGKGTGMDETQWLDLGAVALADAGIARGWPPFLMAMPRQPEPLFSGSDGGPGSYEAELLEGLLPYLQATYRLRRDAEGRALLGLSRGGVWALEIGLRRPDLFAQVAALSPALAVNYPRPAYDPFALAEAGGPLPARVHLSAGEADWARSETERLAGMLQATGVEVEMLLVPGDHSRDTWLQALPEALAFLVEGWEKAPPAR